MDEEIVFPEGRYKSPCGLNLKIKVRYFLFGALFGALALAMAVAIY